MCYYSEVPELRIPLLETAVEVEGSTLIVNGEVFQISDEAREIIQSQRQSAFKQHTTTQLCSYNITSDMEVDVIDFWVEETNLNKVEKTHDDYYKECFWIFDGFDRASIRMPCMRTGEVRESIPVVKVNDEVFCVNKETKERIEEDSHLHLTGIKIHEEKKTNCEKEFNSSTIFLEKEEKIIDRAYFHVIDSEMYKENEICLRGMFVNF